MFGVCGACRRIRKPGSFDEETFHFNTTSKPKLNPRRNETVPGNSTSAAEKNGGLSDSKSTIATNITAMSIYPNPNSHAEVRIAKDSKKHGPELLSIDEPDYDNQEGREAANTPTYVIGDEVEIYSWSSRGWVAGVVFSVSQNEEGTWVQVRCKMQLTWINHSKKFYYASPI